MQGDPPFPPLGFTRAHTWPRESTTHITASATSSLVPALSAKDALADSRADREEQVHAAAVSHDHLFLLSPSDEIDDDDDDIDDIDACPEKHFLSPVHMYEYEDWAEADSEDETAEVEWDAGITDFALFDDDRRHAQESGTSLSHRWDDLLSNQASALQRSEQRNQGNCATGLASPPRSPRGPSPGHSEDIPDLTPDNSPELHDDFEATELATRLRGRSISNPTTSSRIISSPRGWDEDQRRHDLRQRRTTNHEEPDDDLEEEDDEELIFGLHTAHGRSPHFSRSRLQRPGLRQGRTLSGQAHVWKWPSVYITPVREDFDGEIMAELDDATRS